MVNIPQFTVATIISPTDNGSDYLVERESVIEFPRCHRSRCAVPRISFINDPNDVEVEEVETFSLSLVSHSPLVLPDPYTATVNIRDDSESESTLRNTIVHNLL